MNESCWIDDEEKYKLRHGLRIFRASFLFIVPERLTFYERSLCASENAPLDAESMGAYATCRLTFNLLVKQVRDVLCGYATPLAIAHRKGGTRDHTFWRCVSDVVSSIHNDQREMIEKIWITVAQMDDNMRFLGFSQSRAPVSTCAFDCSMPFEETWMTDEVLNFLNATHEVNRLCNYHVRSVRKTPAQ